MLKSTELQRTRDDTLAPRYDAAVLAERLAQASPHQIIEAAARAMPGRLAAVSSFGTESAVLLKFVADVDPSLPILFLDTLWLFKQTLAYRDTLVAHLGLTDVRTITPSPSALALNDPKMICASAIAMCAAGFENWLLSQWSLRHSMVG